MRLAGNVEEIGLGEVMQIICFSGRSGILRLSGHESQGSMIFRDGRIIRASSSAVKEGVCHILAIEGVITREQAMQARELQISGGLRESVGSVLIRNYNISDQVVEDAAKRQVQRIVHSFFLVPDWDFIFDSEIFKETPEVLKHDLAERRNKPPTPCH